MCVRACMCVCANETGIVCVRVCVCKRDWYVVVCTVLYSSKHFHKAMFNANRMAPFQTS